MQSRSPKEEESTPEAEPAREADRGSGPIARAADVEELPDLGLREVLDTIVEGFIVYDHAWRYRFVNRSAAEALSVVGGREALLGKNVWELFPALRGTPMEENLLRAAVSDQPVEFESYSPVLDRWLSVRATATRHGVAVFFHDVTARRRAEDQLRAREAQLRSIVENSPEGIVLTAPTGQILSVNPAGCRMLGRSEGEICRVGRAGVVDASDPRLSTFLEERARTGRAESEMTLVRGDGSKFPAYVRSVIFEDAAGHRRTSMVFQDLTEAKEREARQAETLRALGEAEESLRLTIENAPIGMALVSLDGRFTRVNARLCEIVGYSAAELMQRRFQDITHPDDLQSDLALADKLLRGEIPRYELPKRYVRKDGAIVDIVLHGSILRSAEGEPRTFIAQIQDVTERKRLEAQLALSDRMASVGTMASGVAHEINNPLAYVITNLDVMAEELRELTGPTPAGRLRELASLLEEARGGAERVRKIVRGLKTFARADAEQRVPLDVVAVVDLARTWRRTRSATARGW